MRKKKGSGFWEQWSAQLIGGEYEEKWYIEVETGGRKENREEEGKKISRRRSVKRKADIANLFFSCGSCFSSQNVEMNWLYAAPEVIMEDFFHNQNTNTTANNNNNNASEETNGDKASREHDTQCDWWTLGVIMFEMVSSLFTPYCSLLSLSVTPFVLADNRCA